MIGWCTAKTVLTNSLIRIVPARTKTEVFSVFPLGIQLPKYLRIFPPSKGATFSPRIFLRPHSVCLPSHEGNHSRGQAGLPSVFFDPVKNRRGHRYTTHHKRKRYGTHRALLRKSKQKTDRWFCPHFFSIYLSLIVTDRSDFPPLALTQISLSYARFALPFAGCLLRYESDRSVYVVFKPYFPPLNSFQFPPKWNSIPF